MRNEITITPVGGNQLELSSKRGETVSKTSSTTLIQFENFTKSFIDGRRA